jgi:hypothetical protein
VAKIGEKIVSPPTTSKPTMKKGIDVWRMEHKAEIASDAKGRLPGAHNLMRVGRSLKRRKRCDTNWLQQPRMRQQRRVLRQAMFMSK